MLEMILKFVLILRAIVIAPFDLMPPEQALDHGFAMVLASSADVPEKRISQIMRHESGGWVDARPGKLLPPDPLTGRRRRGPPRHWPHVAAKFPKLRHYICGVMQATARTPAQCVRWQRDIVLAYRAGADHLRAWFEHCRKLRRHGDRLVRCADAGYALGMVAARLAS